MATHGSFVLFGDGLGNRCAGGLDELLHGYGGDDYLCTTRPAKMRTFLLAQIKFRRSGTDVVFETGVRTFSYKITFAN